ncbi:MAG: hypothetical protein SV760_03775 [Halobacteria archaeon]|nr:hypothetical protein [Halobacteria archaeon]
MELTTAVALVATVVGIASTVAFLVLAVWGVKNLEEIKEAVEKLGESGS